MFNVYLIHKIVLYIGKKSIIRTILEHREYMEYMRNNENIYDELMYKCLIEIRKEEIKMIDDKGWSSYHRNNKIRDYLMMDRWRMYIPGKKIKMIKSMYRMRDRIQMYFPYGMKIMYGTRYIEFNNIGEEIRYHAIKFEINELEGWLKKEGIIKKYENIKELKIKMEKY